MLGAREHVHLCSRVNVCVFVRARTYEESETARA